MCLYFLNIFVAYHFVSESILESVFTSNCLFRYMRLEVPLHIVPTDHISQPCLDSLVDLPRIISQEEEEAYTKTTRVPNMDLVTRIHNGAGSRPL